MAWKQHSTYQDLGLISRLYRLVCRHVCQCIVLVYSGDVRNNGLRVGIAGIAGIAGSLSYSLLCA